MANIDGYSIATLVLFLISTALVIKSLSFNVPFSRKFSIRVTLGLQTAPIIAICILWASQCIGAAQIRDGIIGTDGVKPYNILILFISLAYMSITLDETGVLKAAAFWVTNKGGVNGRKLFFYFYLLLSGISMVIGNDPVILSGTFFLVSYTQAAGLEPLAWLISEFAAANTASMVLFVGNPTNVVICEGFGVNNAAFTAYTILPFIACCITCFAGLAFQFRDRVPKTLKKPYKLNPLSVLRDPVGAIISTVLLVTCLAVIITLSFFHVDVWEVSLPFGIGKLVCDFVRDYIRYNPKNPSRPIELRSDDDLKRTIERSPTLTEFPNVTPSTTVAHTDAFQTNEVDQSSPAQSLKKQPSDLEKFISTHLGPKFQIFADRFPTVSRALLRLPFSLIPFAFSQFILIEALSHQGWIDVFAEWLVKASHKEMIPTIWLVGVLGVILCNGAGTNIGATILLTQVVRAAQMPDDTLRAAAIALAVASNIGAVSFTFSASLAGLLWDSILKDKGITSINQRTFAYWNMLPLLLMTTAGLAVVTAEMVVLYR